MDIRKELEQLQVDVIKEFQRKIKKGEASSTDLSNILKMLKDNGVFIKQEIGENPFSNLLEQFGIKEVTLDKEKELEDKNKQKKLLDNIKSSDDEVDDFIDIDLDDEIDNIIKGQK